MRITITALLASCLLGLSAVAAASDRLPDRGMTQDSVRKQFGTPKRQVAPVGNPPISRWIYDGFTVYFEGNISIHAVSHGRTLTTPPATSTAPASAPAASAPANLVDELPPIEELSPGQTPAGAVPPASPEPAAPAESTFRFDPITGRIIEIGPDGKPVQSPTAQPAPARTPEAPKPVESERAPAAVVPAAPAAPSGGASMRFDPASGRMVEVGPDGQPVAPAPAPTPEPAPAPAPAAPAPVAPAPTTPAPAAPVEEAAPAAGRFRFDPTTGRIVMDEPAPASSEPAPAAEPAPEPAPAAPSAPAPAPEKPPEQPASGGGGFSIQW
jgi:hypothetical protein